MSNLLFILLLLLNANVVSLFSDLEESTKISDDFLIHFLIENDDKIFLTCKNGCAWITLRFSCEDGNCEQRINQYGMLDNRDPNKETENSKDEDLTSFDIVISREQEDFNLACEEGCAWEKLSFNLSIDGQIQAVDRYGTTGVQN